MLVDLYVLTEYKAGCCGKGLSNRVKITHANPTRTNYCVLFCTLMYGIVRIIILEENCPIGQLHCWRQGILKDPINSRSVGSSSGTKFSRSPCPSRQFPYFQSRHWTWLASSMITLTRKTIPRLPNFQHLGSSNCKTKTEKEWNRNTLCLSKERAFLDEAWYWIMRCIQSINRIYHHKDSKFPPHNF